jgi:hypothetical protein
MSDPAPRLPSPAHVAPVTSRGGGPTDPSHDAELRRGIIHTQVSRGTAALLVGAFVLLIAGVPITQAILDRVHDEDSMLLDVFKRAPTRANLKQYEDDLEKGSSFKEAVQPRLQQTLTRWGGVGNKRAVIGKKGWLFYQPGVLSVAGPGFLDPAGQRVRQQAALDDGEAVTPDARPAVLAFDRALAARGIRLVLFPVPDKAALQPAELHGRGQTLGLNPDYPRFLAELRAAGVLVFDPTPQRLTPGEIRFLTQDTHWTPAWMEAVAAELAAFVRQAVTLPPPASPPHWQTTLLPISRVGDIVDMLKLPEGQRLFAPQEVMLRQVQDDKGGPWQPSARGDVLLMGDSFTNVFSAPAMGWGESAGLGPHLALALGREIDVIAQNDSGAWATRKLLSEALAAGEDRLAGKKVVIWELASRELAVGDFRAYPYDVGARR